MLQNPDCVVLTWCWGHCSKESTISPHLDDSVMTSGPFVAQPSSSRFVVPPQEGSDTHYFQAPEHSKGTLFEHSLWHSQKVFPPLFRPVSSPSLTSPHLHVCIFCLLLYNETWPPRVCFYVAEITRVPTDTTDKSGDYGRVHLCLIEINHFSQGT